MTQTRRLSQEFPQVGVRYVVDKIHSGEWEARNGAMCVCGGFECVGVYGGLCRDNDSDAEACPCGCGEFVNLQEQFQERFSHAYLRTGYNLGDEDNPDCLAFKLPPCLPKLFQGQEILERDGTEDYALEMF